jgi:hypothetical protein
MQHYEISIVLVTHARLVARPSMVHRQVAFATRVLGRRRRMEADRIDDRAHHPAKIVLHMTEPQGGYCGGRI